MRLSGLLDVLSGGKVIEFTVPDVFSSVEAMVSGVTRQIKFKGVLEFPEDFETI